MGTRRTYDSSYPFGVYCLQSDIKQDVREQQIREAIDESASGNAILDVIRVKRTLWCVSLTGKHPVELLATKGIRINGHRVKVHKGNYQEARKNVLAGYHPEISGNPFCDSDNADHEIHISDLHQFRAKPMEEHKQATKYWLSEGQGDRAKHEWMIRIQCLEPFLFGGKTFQKEEWIQRLYQVCLISDTKTFTRSEIHPEYFKKLDIMEVAITVCFKIVNDESRLLAMFQILRLLSESYTCTDLMSKVGPETQRQALIMQMVSSVQGTIDSLHPTVNIKQYHEYVAHTAIIFACCHYTDYVLKFFRDKKSPYLEFEASLQSGDKESSQNKEEGNKEFQSKNYTAAVDQYTRGIGINPLSYVLFGNRAQAYLNLQRYKPALCDGRRATVLKPDWPKNWKQQNLYLVETAQCEGMVEVEAARYEQTLPTPSPSIRPVKTAGTQRVKGHYRYTQAAIMLKQPQRAFMLSDKALLLCPQDAELQKQGQALRDQFPFGGSGKHSLNATDSEEEEDEMPELVTSSDDEYNSSDDEPPALSSDDHSDCVEPSYPSRKSVPPKTPNMPSPEMVSQNLENVKKNTIRKKQEKAEREIEQRKRSKQKEEEKDRARKQREINAKKKAESGKSAIQLEREQRETDMKQSLVKGSSELVDQHNYRTAVWNYNNAYEMTKNQKYFPSFGDTDMMVLKYSIATAYVELGTPKEIQDGIGWYQLIIEEHKTPSFPLVFLGLGRALCRQHRYSNAIAPLNTGLDTMKKAKNTLPTYTWPGIDTIIEDSKPAILKERLLEFIELCGHPPPPDAVCRYTACPALSSEALNTTAIYTNDPDFKGYIQVYCFAKCKIEFHPDCWKKHKSSTEGNRLSDKSILSGSCLTPDCKSQVQKIWIIDERQEKKEVTNESYLPDNNSTKHMRIKMKSSVRNSQRKAEKKAARKQKKEEYKKKTTEGAAEQDDIIAAIDSMENTTTENHKQNVKDSRYSTVLKRDEEEDDGMYKMKKGSSHGSKKRSQKEKGSHTLPVNVVFNENDRQLVGEKDVEGEDVAQGSGYKFSVSTKRPAPSNMGIDDFSDANRFSVLNPSNPFAVPDNLRDDVDEFESMLQDTVPLTTLPSPPADPMEQSIKENIYSFFAGLLREQGPLCIDSPILTSELDHFPPEASTYITAAGGIGKFLIQSLQFAMIDNYICLMQDAVKARNLAMEARKGKQTVPVYPKPTTSKPITPTITPTPPSSIHFSSSPDPTSVVSAPSPVEFKSSSKSNKKKKKKNQPTLSMPASSDLPETSSSQSPSVDHVKDVFRKQVYEVAGKQLESEEDLLRDSPLRDSESPFSAISEPVSARRNSASSSVTGSEPELDMLRLAVSRGLGGSKGDSGKSTPKRSVINGISSPAAAVAASPSRALFGTTEELQKKKDNVKTLWNLAPAGNNLDEDDTQDLTKLQWDTVQMNWDSIVSDEKTRLPDLPTVNHTSQSSMDEIDDIDDVKELLDEDRYRGDKISPKAPPTPDLTNNPLGASKFGAIGSSKEGSPMRSRDSSLASTHKPFTQDPIGFSSPPMSPLTTIQLADFTKPPPGFVPTEATANPSQQWPTVGKAATEATANPSQQWTAVGKAVGQAINNNNDAKSEPLFNIWGNPSVVSETPTSYPHPLQEIDLRVNQELTSNDNAFVSEIAQSVHEQLSSSLSFSDDPQLYNNIVESIRKDMYSSSNRGSLLPPEPIPPPPPVQRVVTTETAACMTDPLEDFEPMFMNSERERLKISEELQCMSERYTRLKETMTEELRNIQSQIDSYQVECKGLRNEVELANAAMRAERNTFAGEKNSMMEQIQELRRQLEDGKEQQNRVEEELRCYVSRVESAESEMAAEKARGCVLQEQLDAHKETADRHIADAKKRAENAELALLQVKLDVSQQILDRSHGDAENFAQQFRAAVSKNDHPYHPHPPDIAGSLRNGAMKWENTASKVTQIKAATEAAFKEQMLLVRQGAVALSSLPELQLARPPPPPDVPVPSMVWPNLASGFVGRPSSPLFPAPPATATVTGPPPPASLPPGLGISIGGGGGGGVGGAIGGAIGGAKAKVGGVNKAPPTSFSTALKTSSKVSAAAAATGSSYDMDGFAAIKKSGSSRMSSSSSSSSSSITQGSVSAVTGEWQSVGQNGKHTDKKPKNNFERIMEGLKKIDPDLQRSDIESALIQLRSSRNGSLTGMKFEEIINEVAEIIFTEKYRQQHLYQQRPQQQLPRPSMASRPAPWANAVMSGVAVSGGTVNIEEIFEEEEDPCIICHDELRPNDLARLQCGHRFHTTCIRTWFREQSTCPTCRVHALLPDDFPTLG